MHPRTEELLAYLDIQRSGLRNAFDEVPTALRERSPASERWSVANVIEHLAIVEQRLSGRLSNAIEEARKNGLGPETANEAVLPGLNVERVLDRSTRVTAPEPIRPTGVNVEVAWAAFERANRNVRDVLRAADGLALGTVSMPHPLFGSLSLYHWFGFVGAHEARHTAQIREIASELANQGV